MPLRYIEADIPEGCRVEVEAMLARQQVNGVLALVALSTTLVDGPLARKVLRSLMSGVALALLIMLKV
jgi:hypothetical protein